MSIKLMSAVFNHRFQKVKLTVERKGKPVEKTVLAHSQKLVCLALADHANDEGEGAYPSLTTLELKTNMTRATVCLTLKVLKSSGYITQVGISKRGTTDYTLNIDQYSPHTISSMRRILVGSMRRIPEPSFKPSLTQNSVL